MAVKVEPLGIREIESRLGAFEETFSLSSERFVEAFRNGRLRETPEFHEWASLVEARDIILRRQKA
jgi:hypothetical protein